MAVLGLMPFVFLAALARARVLQGGAVGELISRLGEAPRPGELRDALADALSDPSLELVYWLPESARFVDATGRPFALPKHGSGRAVAPVEREGETIAAIVYDASLDGRPRPRPGGRRRRGARAPERATRRRAARQAGGAARVARAHAAHRTRGAAPARAQPARRRPAAARVAGAQPEDRALEAARGPRRQPRRCSPTPATSSRRPSRSCASWRAGCTRRSFPSAACAPPSRAWRCARPCPVELGAPAGRAPSGGGRAGCLLRRLRGPHERREVR